MVVRAARDKVNAAVCERFGERTGVLDDLGLIVPELRAQGLPHGHRFGRDNVHKRSALSPRKHGPVNFFGNVFVIGQDDSAARAAHGLMGRGRDHVRVRQRVRMFPGGDQSGNMRHVHHQIRADIMRDFRELLEVDDAGVRGRARDDHFGLAGFGLSAYVLIVNIARLRVDAVRDGMIQFSGKAGFTAVGQVSARAEVHAKDGVPGLAEGQIDAEIRL